MSTDDQFRAEIRGHLQDEVADLAPPHDLLPALHRRHTRRVRTFQAAVVGVPLVVAAVVLMPFVSSGSGGKGTPQPIAAPEQGNATSTTLKDLPLTGPKVQLAGYTISLPQGFAPVATAGPNGAVSAVGPAGSIEMLATAEDKLPIKGAEELTVGTHRAYLSTEPTTGRVELDVALPAGPRTHYLQFLATGLTKETLIKMALEHMTPGGSTAPSSPSARPSAAMPTASPTSTRHLPPPGSLPDCAPNCAGG